MDQTKDQATWYTTNYGYKVTKEEATYYVYSA